GTSLIRKAGEAQHYCPNASGCRPQIIGRIQHFISRRAMDIEGLGGETVALLVDAGLIGDFTDLYELKKAQLIPLERMAEKSADNLIKGIESSKAIPFERVLYAIGIRYVGETVAKKLARHFKTIESLRLAAFDDLVSVEEIGEKIAESIVEFFSDDNNLRMINRLQEFGLQLSISEEILAGQTDILKGMRFVVSGVFEQISRNDLKALIEKNGGKVASSISSKTSYVVAGNNMGPSKREKAEALEIPIIDEQEFLQMIN
ncbi:MAG: NAD-dependent DNA ligase LigA, partial [Bacteroidia bacterium]|nr:NAD-dependent DNA ligase LigA [Bacteroidia bacterium]